MEKARNEYKKGLWTDEEDKILMEHIRAHGTGKWNRVAQVTGLKRCGKSCRLRWINYLSPDVKRGHFSEQEDDLIIRLHNLLGNRWSLIAGRVPGRTDNQVKNHWNTHLSKKLGIRRDKIRVRASCSPSTSQVALSIKPEEYLENPSTQSTSSPISFNNIDGGSNEIKASEDGSVGAVEDSSMQEPRIMNEDYDSFFRYSSDYMSQDLPSLMEFVDGCSLDYLWHCL